jgi:hypothetical protein
MRNLPTYSISAANDLAQTIQTNYTIPGDSFNVSQRIRESVEANNKELQDLLKPIAIKISPEDVANNQSLFDPNSKIKATLQGDNSAILQVPTGQAREAAIQMPSATFVQPEFNNTKVIDVFDPNKFQALLENNQGVKNSSVFSKIKFDETKTPDLIATTKDTNINREGSVGLKQNEVLGFHPQNLGKIDLGQIKIEGYKELEGSQKDFSFVPNKEVDGNLQGRVLAGQPLEYDGISISKYNAYDTAVAATDSSYIKALEAGDQTAVDKIKANYTDNFGSGKGRLQANFDANTGTYNIGYSIQNKIDQLWKEKGLLANYSNKPLQSSIENINKNTAQNKGNKQFITDLLGVAYNMTVGGVINDDTLIGNQLKNVSNGLASTPLAPIGLGVSTIVTGTVTGLTGLLTQATAGLDNTIRSGTAQLAKSAGQNISDEDLKSRMLFTNNADAWNAFAKDSTDLNNIRGKNLSKGVDQQVKNTSKLFGDIFQAKWSEVGSDLKQVSNNVYINKSLGTALLSKAGNDVMFASGAKSLENVASSGDSQKFILNSVFGNTEQEKVESLRTVTDLAVITAMTMGVGAVQGAAIKTAVADAGISAIPRGIVVAGEQTGGVLAKAGTRAGVGAETFGYEAIAQTREASQIFNHSLLGIVPETFITLNQETGRIITDKNGKKDVSVTPASELLGNYANTLANLSLGNALSHGMIKAGTPFLPEIFAKGTSSEVFSGSLDAVTKKNIGKVALEQGLSNTEKQLFKDAITGIENMGNKTLFSPAGTGRVLLNAISPVYQVATFTGANMLASIATENLQANMNGAKAANIDAGKLIRDNLFLSTILLANPKALLSENEQVKSAVYDKFVNKIIESGTRKSYFSLDDAITGINTTINTVKNGKGIEKNTQSEGYVYKEGQKLDGYYGDSYYKSPDGVQQSEGTSQKKFLDSIKSTLEQKQKNGETGGVTFTDVLNKNLFKSDTSTGRAIAEALADPKGKNRVFVVEYLPNENADKLTQSKATDQQGKTNAQLEVHVERDAKDAKGTVIVDANGDPVKEIVPLKQVVGEQTQSPIEKHGDILNEVNSFVTTRNALDALNKSNNVKGTEFRLIQDLKTKELLVGKYDSKTNKITNVITGEKIDVGDGSNIKIVTKNELRGIQEDIVDRFADLLPDNISVESLHKIFDDVSTVKLAEQSQPTENLEKIKDQSPSEIQNILNENTAARPYKYIGDNPDLQGKYFAGFNMDKDNVKALVDGKYEIIGEKKDFQVMSKTTDGKNIVDPEYKQFLVDNNVEVKDLKSPYYTPKAGVNEVAGVGIIDKNNTPGQKMSNTKLHTKLVKKYVEEVTDDKIIEIVSPALEQLDKAGEFEKGMNLEAFINELSTVKLDEAQLDFDNKKEDFKKYEKQIPGHIWKKINNYEAYKAGDSLDGSYDNELTPEENFIEAGRLRGLKDSAEATLILTKNLRLQLFASIDPQAEKDVGELMQRLSKDELKDTEHYEGLQDPKNQVNYLLEQIKQFNIQAYEQSISNNQNNPTEPVQTVPSSQSLTEQYKPTAKEPNQKPDTSNSNQTSSPAKVQGAQAAKDTAKPVDVEIAKVDLEENQRAERQLKRDDINNSIFKLYPELKGNVDDRDDYRRAITKSLFGQTSTAEKPNEGRQLNEQELQQISDEISKRAKEQNTEFLSTDAFGVIVASEPKAKKVDEQDALLGEGDTSNGKVADVQKALAKAEASNKQMGVQSVFDKNTNVQQNNSNYGEQQFIKNGGDPKGNRQGDLGLQPDNASLKRVEYLDETGSASLRVDDGRYRGRLAGGLGNGIPSQLQRDKTQDSTITQLDPISTTGLPGANTDSGLSRLLPAEAKYIRDRAKQNIEEFDQYGRAIRDQLDITNQLTVKEKEALSLIEINKYNEQLEGVNNYLANFDLGKDYRTNLVINLHKLSLFGAKQEIIDKIYSKYEANPELFKENIKSIVLSNEVKKPEAVGYYNRNTKEISLSMSDMEEKSSLLLNVVTHEIAHAMNQELVDSMIKTMSSREVAEAFLSAMDETKVFLGPTKNKDPYYREKAYLKQAYRRKGVTNETVTAKLNQFNDKIQELLVAGILNNKTFTSLFKDTIDQMSPEAYRNIVDELQAHLSGLNESGHVYSNEISINQIVKDFVPTKDYKTKQDLESGTSAFIKSDTSKPKLEISETKHPNLTNFEVEKHNYQFLEGNITGGTIYARSFTHESIKNFMNYAQNTGNKKLLDALEKYLETARDKPEGEDKPEITTLEQVAESVGLEKKGVSIATLQDVVEMVDPSKWIAQNKQTNPIAESLRNATNWLVKGASSIGSVTAVETIFDINSRIFLENVAFQNKIDDAFNMEKGKLFERVNLVNPEGILMGTKVLNFDKASEYWDELKAKTQAGEQSSMVDKEIQSHLNDYLKYSKQGNSVNTINNAIVFISNILSFERTDNQTGFKLKSQEVLSKIQDKDDQFVWLKTNGLGMLEGFTAGINSYQHEFRRGLQGDLAYLRMKSIGEQNQFNYSEGVNLKEDSSQIAKDIDAIRQDLNNKAKDPEVIRQEIVILMEKIIDLYKKSTGLSTKEFDDGYKKTLPLVVEFQKISERLQNTGRKIQEIPEIKQDKIRAGTYVPGIAGKSDKTKEAVKSPELFEKVETILDTANPNAVYEGKLVNTGSYIKLNRKNNAPLVLEQFDEMHVSAVKNIVYSFLEDTVAGVNKLENLSKDLTPIEQEAFNTGPLILAKETIVQFGKNLTADSFLTNVTNRVINPISGFVMGGVIASRAMSFGVNQSQAAFDTVLASLENTNLSAEEKAMGKEELKKYNEEWKQELKKQKEIYNKLSKEEKATADKNIFNYQKAALDARIADTNASLGLNRFKSRVKYNQGVIKANTDNIGNPLLRNTVRAAKAGVNTVGRGVLPVFNASGDFGNTLIMKMDNHVNGYGAVLQKIINRSSKLTPLQKDIEYRRVLNGTNGEKSIALSQSTSGRIAGQMFASTLQNIVATRAGSSLLRKIMEKIYEAASEPGKFKNTGEKISFEFKLDDGSSIKVDNKKDNTTLFKIIGIILTGVLFVLLFKEPKEVLTKQKNIDLSTAIPDAFLNTITGSGLAYAQTLSGIIGLGNIFQRGTGLLNKLFDPAEASNYQKNMSALIQWAANLTGQANLFNAGALLTGSYDNKDASKELNFKDTVFATVKDEVNRDPNSNPYFVDKVLKTIFNQSQVGIEKKKGPNLVDGVKEIAANVDLNKNNQGLKPGSQEYKNEKAIEDGTSTREEVNKQMEILKVDDIKDKIKNINNNIANSGNDPTVKSDETRKLNEILNDPKNKKEDVQKALDYLQTNKETIGNKLIEEKKGKIGLIEALTPTQSTAKTIDALTTKAERAQAYKDGTLIPKKVRKGGKIKVSKSSTKIKTRKIKLSKTKSLKLKTKKLV